ncbi:hypothetical protein AB1K32_06655 [Metabacillus dongyingensis]|uniref:hypothetical protein n=1 Tax=Metabacillus dongyingensis TaxID=2874282 RepID=UPI003B8D1971
MKLGVSSYSLYQEIKNGMSILDVMEWVKGADGEHVEIVSLGFDLTKSPQIAGDGDLNMRDILKVIKKSGYSGYLSIEFEGLEDCRYGTKTSLENVKKILQEI